MRDTLVIEPPIEFPERCHLRSILIGAAASLCLVLSQTPGQANTFDGNWMVHALATPGHCTDNYGMAIRVSSGRVTYRGLLAAFATGKVSNNGRLSLQIGEAKATGQLTASSGNGTWASPKCKGKWTAARN
jgi:hypothetical protein